MLITYKKECYKALADYWLKGKAERAVSPVKLSADHQTFIKNFVMQRTQQLPKEQQAKGAIMQWSALKSHFGKSYKEIDESQFVEAVSLLARLSLEGELIDIPLVIETIADEEALHIIVNLFHSLNGAYELSGKLRNNAPYIARSIDKEVGGYYLYNLGEPTRQTLDKARRYIQAKSERIIFVKGMLSLLEAPKRITN